MSGPEVMRSVSLFLAGTAIGFCAGGLAICSRGDSSVGATCDTVTVVRCDTFRVITPSAAGVTDLGLRMMTLPAWRCGSAESCSVTVALPVERKVYSDSAYRAVVSGIGVSLDSLEVYRMQTFTSMTYKPVKWRDKRWVIGPSVGVGFDGRRFRPFAGVTLTYRFLTF